MIIFLFLILIVPSMQTYIGNVIYKFDTITIPVSEWNPKSSFQNIKSNIHCSTRCISAFSCSAFHYDTDTKICQLGSKIGLMKIQTTSGTIIKISINVEDPWIILVEGWNNGFVTGVELFNWQTGNTCSRQDLPMSVADGALVFMDGYPIQCGGGSFLGYQENRCFKYVGTSDTWLPIANMSNGPRYTSATLVPNIGYIVYGGSSQSKIQILPNVNANWTLGPPLFEVIYNHCIVQIDDYTTAILGGNNRGGRAIVTFDWKTKVYTLQSAQLIRRRVTSGCGLVRKMNGPMEVAVAGGDSSMGLEIWNPLQQTVALVNEILPQEQIGSVHLTSPAIVSVNGNTEILLFNGQTNQFITDVWKFNYQRNSWLKVGDTMIKRANHRAVRAVEIECP